MDLKLCLLSWVFWSAVHYYIDCVSGDTTITATAPLEEVEEGNILSVHCQVSEKQEGQEVGLFRIRDGQRTERLTTDSAISSSLAGEERLFIAERQLSDGTMVFFLSIMEVTRQDQGTYLCKVHDLHQDKTVSESSVHIAVLYFPDEHPMCSHRQSLQIIEGGELELNCTSIKANPILSLSWSRTQHNDKDLTSRSKLSSNASHVTSTLRLRPRVSDSGAVYICKASSTVFPHQTLTCHFGQIRVLPNPHGSILPEEENHGISVDIITDDPTTRHQSIMECSELCSTTNFDSPIFKWIISTTIAGVIALTFLIIIIVFLWKYYNVQHTTRNLYVTARPQLADQVYSEPECKRSDNMTYMSLTKEDTKRLNHQFMTKYCPTLQYEDKA